MPLSTGALDRLTPRETEVAALVAEGLSHKSVARRLGISSDMVKVHASRAAQKLPGIGRPSVKITRIFSLIAASDSA